MDQKTLAGPDILDDTKHSRVGRTLLRNIRSLEIAFPKAQFINKLWTTLMVTEVSKHVLKPETR